jgi:3-oxoacyl-[acyl-carrier-protein] synthase III
MRMTNVFLSGLGVFLPDTVSIESAAENCDYSAEEVKRHGWTGLAVAGELPAPEMGLRAARTAFECCGRAPESADLLIYTDCWHQGPDGWHPQSYLQRHLVGGDLLAVELKNGCNAAFSALELAASYLHAGDLDVALIVASDNFGTPLVSRWTPSPGFLLGDAAAAMVVTREPGFARVLSVNSITITEAEEAYRCGEPLFPPGATVGRFVDLAGRATAFTKKQVEEDTVVILAAAFQSKPRECLTRTLREAGTCLDDIAAVTITHTSREDAEMQFMRVLELPLSKTTWEYGCAVGHLASADHMVSLHHLLSTGRIGPGDRVLMIGASSGITYSCAVIEILSPAPWTLNGSKDGFRSLS